MRVKGREGKAQPLVQDGECCYHERGAAVLSKKLLKFLRFKIYIALIIVLQCCGNTNEADHEKPNSLSANGAVLAESKTLEALSKTQRYFDSVLQARYMEQECSPATYPGWEGFPLRKCEYSVTDRDGTKKTAEVIMLNPSPEQLARWSVFACSQLDNADEECPLELAKHTVSQSGGQFPIAGIVFEDILPPDGTYEVYCFRNGVTVGVEGVAHRGTRQPSQPEIEASLRGNVLWTGKYARLQSTTREQYYANGGTVDVGDSSDPKPSWLEVSRILYQVAWGNDRNELMIAWAKGNL